MEAAAQEMAEEEQRIMRRLGWKGQGLVTASGATAVTSVQEGLVAEGVAREGGAGNVAVLERTEGEGEGEVVKKHQLRRARQPRYKLLLCDMDGEAGDRKSVM